MRLQQRSRGTRGTDQRLLRALLLLGLALGTLLGTLPGCLERREAPAGEGEFTRCATCHGDPARDPDSVLASAPPGDLWGSQEPSFPGVGAHQIHLSGSDTHEAFECSECHVVPHTVEEPGHADDPRPAEVVFGALAKTGDREPEYDPVARRCSDTWCHRSADAVWTRPKSSAEACGSCHGLPPPEPHPQSEACHVCHGAVVNDRAEIAEPALHVNGTVELDIGECVGCHGDSDTAAPPVDTEGNSSVSALGVGAHRAHLAGGSWSRPLDCSECHRVPEDVDDPAHIDARPAEVLLDGVSRSGGREPAWDRESESCADTWCHAPSAPGGSSPRWTSAPGLRCGECHGAPPPLPHPQVTNCEACHGAVVGPDLEIVDRTRHVDGTVDLDVTSDCTACHGRDNAAPPVDVDGNASPASPTVGAHQTHVLGSSLARAVPCQECHVVPEDVLAPGHIDSDRPAEVVFSGTAQAFGAEPTYEAGSCTNSYCHGADFPKTHESGGAITVPLWTQVDGSQTECGSCHGLPPPLPHPPIETCSDCHLNVLSDQRSFLYPELHVNGIVDNLLP
ncbi:MAG TPA: CxxxxCH/CxxCH domain-containing protein [Polyangiaceae bacterium]|nr:CxxxxCH/CxxCH domain-containing protein [Polyangiaceae bacterium]